MAYLEINGRKITSDAQLRWALTHSVEKRTEDILRKAAGPGVRMKKTRKGYTFEGSPEQIERMKKRLR
ncbi:MAG: hypothetical protein GDA53_05850 [Rhodobacteraceae bacterium]|nr:hypothetical protein [Paracoccaceae bacterium]